MGPSDQLREHWASGNVRVEVPDGSGAVAWVPRGADNHRLDDGRILRLEWVETMPESLGRVTIEGPLRDRQRAAIDLMMQAAIELAGDDSIHPRDRAAIIGGLRNLAMQTGGLRTVPDFPSLPLPGRPKE